MPKSSPSTWLELPSPFTSAPGSVLLADPPLTHPRKLRQMLLDESYPKPFAIDDGEFLILYFNIRLLQSVMYCDEPDTLAVRYTRKMMAFLAFNPRPERIALIGMGGGSLVKYCRRWLPWCHLTAIELDADVLAFRDLFRVPPDGPLLRTLQTDGADWLARTRQRLDAVLVDAFDTSGVAPVLANRDFFETCHARLTPKGALVVNLAGDRRRFRRMVAEAADVFGGRVIVVPVRGDGNAVLYAFRDEGFAPNWRRLHREAKPLQERFALDLPDFVTKMERAATK